MMVCRKRKIIITLILIGIVCSLLVAGCGGIDEDTYKQTISELETAKATVESATAEYDAIKTQLDGLTEEHNQLLAEHSKLEDDYAKLETDYEKISSEYAEYKVRMTPYEALDEAEAKARQIEADAAIAAAEEEAARKAEAEKAEAERKAAEEQAEKERKEKQGYDTGITYSQLARTPDDYIGEKVKFYGKVLQVIEGDEEIQIRLAVKGDYDDIILCGYDPSIVSSRVLEDDYITVYGLSVGLFSYQSTFGGTITIPAVYVEKIDQ